MAWYDFFTSHAQKASGVAILAEAEELNLPLLLVTPIHSGFCWARANGLNGEANTVVTLDDVGAKDRL